MKNPYLRPAHPLLRAHPLSRKVLDAIETTPRHSSLNLLALTFYIHHLSVFLQPEGGEN